MKKNSIFLKKNIVILVVAFVFLAAAIVAAIFICKTMFANDANIQISSSVNAENTVAYLTEQKAEEERKAEEEAAKKAEEEKKAAEEAAKKAEEEKKAAEEKAAKEAANKNNTSSSSKTDSATYQEYLKCMEKVNELEKTLSSDPSAWNMILCNPTHPLPDGYIENIKLKSIFETKYKVDERIWYNVKAMFLAAKMDGINLTMVSAFRDIALQTRNFNNKKNSYINSGMSEKAAYAKTATIIAVPGTSEHHTGLALDILCSSYGSLTAGFDQTKAYKWLNEHCTEYGFIMRYAKDKQSVTKIIYEPWHYRFVGIANAKKIAATGLCYEEYLGITD